MLRRRLVSCFFPVLIIMFCVPSVCFRELSGTSFSPPLIIVFARDEVFVLCYVYVDRKKAYEYLWKVKRYIVIYSFSLLQLYSYNEKREK